MRRKENKNMKPISTKDFYMKENKREWIAPVCWGLMFAIAFYIALGI